MLKYVHVVPLATESLGVRSMCTYVETPDIRVLLDAGVSLCPYRFGLFPHPLEFRAIVEARNRIAEAGGRAEVVTLSHYHFDHHTPSYEDWLCNWTAREETARQIYEGKTVFVKNPKECINYSQRRRGWMFQRTGGKYAKKLEVADGKSFVFGKDTVVKFSEPVFHGSENSALGWVLMVSIECHGEKFMFAPDVQGPMVKRTLEIIMEEKPQLLMIGGPPLYLANFKVDESQIKVGLENFERIVESVPCVILDHHVLRDEDWHEKMQSILDTAGKTGCEVLTAAEFLGEKNVFLEAWRRRLFVEDPPPKEFEKWMRGYAAGKKRVKPPV
jgi:predicted metallo-beta-lactamase superfamily hydrolase